MPEPEKGKSPYEAAKAVLDQLSIRTPPSPVERIAREMGAQVRFSPFDDELSGMIYIKEGIPIIGVNALHHPHRQRFTIGHELGHLALHRDIITNAIHVDKEFPALMRDVNAAKGTERIEIEANQFAAELLMPRVLVQQALESTQFDIDDEGPLEQLAKKFKVSRQALEYRIRSLR